MELWVIIREGVYDHGIMYIGTDEAQTKEMAETIIKREPDSYHAMRMDKMELGVDKEATPVRTLHRSDRSGVVCLEWRREDGVVEK